jgi:hypothetical protein
VKRTLVGLCALWLGSAAVSGRAAADPTPVPAACADGARKARAHELGRRQGHAIVESAWSTLRQDCSQRDQLDRTVRDALARRATPAAASETWRCRNSGLEAGANDRLANVAAACTGNQQTPGGSR